MHTVPFEELPGFSTLFRDFCRHRDAIMSRFPTNAALYDAQYWAERAARQAETSYDRTAIVRAIKQTMAGFALSPAQQDSLAALSEPTTFLVVTGQQAGILGGALYTLLKAWSAVQAAQTLTTTWQNAENPNTQGEKVIQQKLRAIPLFWVEDNDHDLAEISTIGLVDRQGDIRELRLEWIMKEDTTVGESVVSGDVSSAASRIAPSHTMRWNAPEERTSISELRFNAAVCQLVDQTREALGLTRSFVAQADKEAPLRNPLPQATEFAGDIMALVESLYAEGESLARAFTGVMHYLMAETGMLFVSAATLRNEGVFADVIRRELSQPEASEAALHTAEQVLKANGYHVQASASPLNVFYHDENGKRWKVSRVAQQSATESQQFQASFQVGGHVFTQEHLIGLSHSEPERFSPNVLLRPIVQDAVLPTVAYIAGPGEVGYLAQLKELYAVFGVQPSAVIARHSATFLDARAIQFFEKHTAGFTFDRIAAMLQPYHQLEQSVIQSVATDNATVALERAHAATEQMYKELYDAMMAFDSTLGATVEKTKVHALQGLEALASKVRKVRKQQQETLLNKVRKVHTIVYPMSALQERALTPLSFVNRYGLAALSATLQELMRHAPDQHYIVPLVHQ